MGKQKQGRKRLRKIKQVGTATATTAALNVDKDIPILGKVTMIYSRGIAHIRYNVLAKILLPHFQLQYSV